MSKFCSVFLVAFALMFVTANAQAQCNIKGVVDPKDGKVFYTSSHRLYKYVDPKKSKGAQTFCTEGEARTAGFSRAKNNFSNSTARLVDCVEDGEQKCMNYVLGQYKSLDIYDKVCADGTSSNEILESFMNEAKASTKLMDVERFYGTTGALMQAYPCGRTSRN